MGSEFFLIERHIEIDAGHRIPHHGSLCKNLHGHRYKIVAVCKGRLSKSGEQEGMVMDFGFLKDEMMKEIHEPCDHVMILSQDDPLLLSFLDETDTANKHIKDQEFYKTESRIGTLYLINDTPTAENLAAHWFKRLSPCIEKRSKGSATLHQIKVYETPNCVAIYPA